MFLQIVTKKFHNLYNLPGYRQKRKIVVIESDDWGSIRMPSNEVFKNLEKAGLDLRSWDAERYNLNDSLASSNDLENLFEVLSGVNDQYGQCAVFTPITIVANPDFPKIKDSMFHKYFFEPFTETLKRYPGCEKSFSLWQEGIAKKLFVPQMHGREHLNVTAWLRALQNGDKKTHLAFNEGFWGFVPDQNLLPGVDFQAAFLLNETDELNDQRKVIVEGLQLFEQIFSYKAEYFVPPNGPFNNQLNTTLAENGIKLRTAPIIQHETLGHGKKRKVFHWLGQKDKVSGLKYVIRNCFFEPNQVGKNWIDSCLRDVDSAFRWHKPAIISSHRANYISALNRANRDRGLLQLDALLKSIVKHWSDVQVMTTAELGYLMTDYYSKR